MNLSGVSKTVRCEEGSLGGGPQDRVQQCQEYPKPLLYKRFIIQGFFTLRCMCALKYSRNQSVTSQVTSFCEKTYAYDTVTSRKGEDHPSKTYQAINS